MKKRFSRDSFPALLLRLRSAEPSLEPRDLETIQRSYEGRVFSVLEELDAVRDEISRLLRTMSAITDYTDAIIAVKFYVISWCTLADVTARLICEVFDLGIHKHDIRLAMILRNTHVTASTIPQVFKTHKDELRLGQFQELRNAIVHRGTLTDSDTEALNMARRRFRLLEILRKNQARKWRKDFEATVKHYVAAKRSDFTGHFNSTDDLLEDLMVPLGQRIVQQTQDVLDVPASQAEEAP